MIRRYLQIKECLKETLELFNDGQLFTNRHDEALSELISSLQPIEEAVVTLSKKNTNLMSAEGAMKFIHAALSKQTSAFSKQLLELVMKRYNERRNEEIISLLLLLQTGSFPKSTQGFEYSSKAQIKRTANELIGRLFPDSEVVHSDETSASRSPQSVQEGIQSLTQVAEKTIDKNLEKDLKLFEATGEKSQRLKKLYDALVSIQPTSTSCEQVFSVAGSFKTKIRNRIMPRKLSILVWLKYYFVKN